MCFDLEEIAVLIENRSVALGTCRLAHSLCFGFFAYKVRTAGPIAMGVALIDVLRHRGNCGAC